MDQGDARSARFRAALSDGGIELKELPGGVVSVRYAWNRMVQGEGIGYQAAFEALRRTHLLIGNSVDGRWTGINWESVMSKTKTKTSRKPKAAPKDTLAPAPADMQAPAESSPSIVQAPVEAEAPSDGWLADELATAGVKTERKRNGKPDDAPVKVSKTREGMKIAGDRLPVDLAGGMLAEGSIVAVPVVFPGEHADDPGVRLRLGYVKKLGKSFIDVIVFVTATETESFRCTDPRNELITVNPELLNSRVPLYEAVKLAAAINRY